ncbi:MAG: PD-(D/E)XK nuclease family protein, partial [Calditrichia bacterium]
VSGPGFLDEAAFLETILQNLEECCAAPPFNRVQHLVLENAADLKEIHFRLLDQFKSLGWQIYLLFRFGENPAIDAGKESLNRRLEALSDRIVEYPDAQGFSSRLFRMDGGKADAANMISIESARDRLSEVESVAARIKELMLKGKLHYSDFAIAPPRLAGYRQHIETVLNRHQIPCHFAEGQPLSQSLPLQHLLLFFRCLREDFPLNTLQKLLQSPFFKYHQQTAGLPLRNLLDQLRIRGGRNLILKQIEQLQRLHHGGAAEAAGKKWAVLQETLKHLFRETEAFPPKKSAEEFLRLTADLIRRHPFYGDTTLPAERDRLLRLQNRRQALDFFLEKLQEWQQAFSVCFPAALLRFEDFLEAVEYIISTYHFHPRRPRNAGVTVLPLAQAVRGGCTHLFIPGMEEGAIPRPESGGLAAAQLIPHPLKPFAGSETLFRERELFLEVLQSGAEVHFLYPRFHKDNPVLPSGFLRELKRVLHIKESNPPEPLLTRGSVLEEICRLQQETGKKEGKLPEPLQKIISAAEWAQLQRRLRVESLRSKKDAFSEFEGNLQSRPAAGWLNYYFRQRPFSVSRLETYAACPMIFFFQQIMGVEPREEAAEELTALDRGLLIHDILYRFYRDYLPEKQSEARLKEIAEKALAALPLRRTLLRQLDEEYLLGNAEQPGLLSAFWEYEKQARQEFTTVPKHFEFSFGAEPRGGEEADPASTAEPLRVERNGETYLFRGKIDRIEIGPQNELLVVDYKTGREPAFRELWEGRSLQLPLYLLAASRLLNDGAYQPAGGVYYLLKDAREINKKIAFLSADTPITGRRGLRLPYHSYRIGEEEAGLQDFLQRSLTFAVDYIRQIRSGRYNQTTESTRCRGFNGKDCLFRPLCRLNPEKQAHLRQAEESGEANGRPGAIHP